MRSPATLAAILATVACHASGSIGLSSMPPYPGIVVKPAFQVEAEGSTTRWYEFSRGEVARRGELAIKGRATRWRLRYNPNGVSEWTLLDGRGRVIQFAQFDQLGPFVGRMPTAVWLEDRGNDRPITLDGEPVPLEAGASGTRYLTGQASPFQLSGPFDGSLVRVTLLGRSSDLTPTSLLPLAAVGVIALGSPDDPVPDPVPEPSTLLATFGLVGLWTRRFVSVRRAR
ncbi:MAG: PEP-CTERM sorting domain-containing protein [Fimbriimonadaceae bacterium]|nr:PEP-CTERM sorting domain-containing protein [Fimbriimonadaceae bacterium]